MLQSVISNNNGSNLPQGIIMNQTNGFSSVHNNQFSSQIHSAQSGLAGANLKLSNSQQSQQMVNTNQLYGFQQSNLQSSPIYSSLSLQTNSNISGPMQQQITQSNDNQNVKAAYEQVNQLKQLHHRLLMQQMNNEQRPQTAQIPISNLSSNVHLSTHVNNDNKQSHMPSNQCQNNTPQPFSLENNLKTSSADDVSANINQKLIQLKQQLEQQQQIQSQRSNIVPNGETKLQMQLRQHIINQQKKSDKNSSNSSSNGSSGKNSPKSCGGKRDKKPKQKVSINGYSSGESSTGSSKTGNNTNTTNKRTFNQSLGASENAPVMGNIGGGTQGTQGAAALQQSKFQMYDHSTEQKRRRLQTASFRQNQVFHTSGNRLIPMLPKSILGVKTSVSSSCL